MAERAKGEKKGADRAAVGELNRLKGVYYSSLQAVCMHACMQGQEELPGVEGYFCGA